MMSGENQPQGCLLVLFDQRYPKDSMGLTFQLVAPVIGAVLYARYGSEKL